MNRTIAPIAALLLATLGISEAGCSTSADAAVTAQDRVERGRYLVTAAGCNDCHTPMIMGPEGKPIRDPNHLLAGHPEQIVVPAPPAPQGPWIVSTTDTMTAWTGPWGVSYTANLTPDPETGLGTWTETTFIETIRNARHMGRGRPLLPPMPADMIATYTDEDLGAIFAYLQSIPAVTNHVPAPVPPQTAAR